MQNIKNTIKRIAAISAGTLMIGATVFGAAAAATYTLADYPSPFITNGKWVGLVVIGADSAGADSVGAVDIMATLAQGSTGGGTSSSISGGESKDVELGECMFASATGTYQMGYQQKDDDVAGLIDSELTFDDGVSSTDLTY